ncbi:MAG TPA: hypothetical protein VHL10_05135 [Nitrososphaera sp.]|nr:hypothetical protein [Nitrososphaera sp.]
MPAFSSMMDDLQYNIDHNRDLLAAALKRSPNIAYQKVNELAVFVGSRHGVDLQLHFPIPCKIMDLGAYGTENVGIVVDKFKKTFPVPRETVKQKAVELLGGDARPQDAYMYEGKEGVKVVMPEGRIEILPGSVHFWCKVDDKVRLYGDWLMQNVYLPDNKGVK